MQEDAVKYTDIEGFNMYSLRKIIIAPLFLLVAHTSVADIVVVASSKTGHDALSKSMVKKIFLKKVAALPDGSSIEPIDLVDSNDLKWDFYKEVARKKPAQIHSYWSRAIFTGIDKPPVQVKNSNQLKNIIAKNPSLIGYMDEKDLDDSLKVLYRIKT